MSINHKTHFIINNKIKIFNNNNNHSNNYLDMFDILYPYKFFKDALRLSQEEKITISSNAARASILGIWSIYHAYKASEAVEENDYDEYYKLAYRAIIPLAIEFIGLLVSVIFTMIPGKATFFRTTKKHSGEDAANSRKKLVLYLGYVHFLMFNRLDPYVSSSNSFSLVMSYGFLALHFLFLSLIMFHFLYVIKRDGRWLKVISLSAGYLIITITSTWLFMTL